MTVVVISDRVPPQSKEAEQSVLGSMIIDREAIFAAAELLVENDFYSTAHQKIFNAAVALSEKGEPVDTIISTTRKLFGRRPFCVP